MINTSGDLLEFEQLRELVGRYVGSAQGRDELRRLSPSSDRKLIEETHAITGEAIEYLKTASQPQTVARGAVVRLRFTDIPDLQAAAQKLRIEGAVLDGKEIFDLLSLVDRASDARMLLTATADRFPRLAKKASAMGDLRGLVHDLAGKILPDGSVSDDASVALHRIRRGIERQKKAIQDSLERFLKAHRTDGVLQEDFVTLRNERFVVPVVAGQQGRVNGVIHGSSGSGHTLFVEPLDTIDLNNELVRMTEEELREVHRILREMTNRLRARAGEVIAAIWVMGELDFLFAKANFAVEFDCVVPRFSSEEEPVLKLEAARHPLLQDVLRRQNKRIVPISFTLSARQRTLLLSGPNTGGKTVTLKTTGLLALMAQAGLPVPAREAEFPVFDQVLADLGDNQSITESLSSFSAHIRRIREMLTIVTPDSLVLLDELGRATDPEEGGALGVAIVEHFRSWRAFTLASTHLLALKVYGASREGVTNGSMGFDKETLEPTYLLRVGAPGESAGLDIASRLGMPADLIERARAAMTTRERDLADFLSQLQLRTEQLAAEQKALEEQRLALQAREKQIAEEWARKENAKLKEMEQRVEAMLARFEEHSQETIDSILQTAAQRKASESAQRKVAKAMRELREEFQTAVAEAKGGGEQHKPVTLRIEEGSRVRLKNVREPARVKRRLSHDRLEVESGFLKMQVSIDDVLEVLPEAGGSSKLPANVTFHSEGPKWDVSYRELNVIGKRAEEAVEEVDRFLDQAMMASIDRVRIVHGHGMGVLRKAISDLLGKHPHVAKFYAASQGEGGTGATIAELK
jgi:DNA mismatch repair protein MutS2